MIYLCIGDVGAGKSSWLVQDVLLPALREKRQVWTNLKLKPWFAKKWKSRITRFNNFLDHIPMVTDDGDLVKNPRRKEIPPGALLIVDEAGLQLMSGMADEKTAEARGRYKRLRMYLAQHRHFCDAQGRSTDLFFAAQDSSQITSQVRNLTSYTIYLRALKMLIGFKRGAEYRLFFQCPSRHDIQSRGRSDGGGHSTLSRGIFRPKKWVYGIYQSYDIPDALSAMETMKFKPALNSRLMLLAMFVTVIISGIYLSIDGYNSIIGGDGYGVKKGGAAPVVAPADSEGLRLAGYAEYDGRHRSCWVGGDGYIRACGNI